LCWEFFRKEFLGAGEDEAFGGLEGGADDVFGCGVEGAVARQVDAGELQAVEDGGSALHFEIVGGERVDDEREGHLDGGSVFEGADFEARSIFVGGFQLAARDVGFVAVVEALMEETEVEAGERG
jgi:hypothetical protein